MKLELKQEKCPFCGDTEVIIGKDARDVSPQEGIPTWIECVMCGARGPSVYEIDHGGFFRALGAWNGREK